MATLTLAPSYKRTLGPHEAPEDWDAYVMNHPKGTVFHTSSMVRAYRDTPKCEPFAIAARNVQGDIVALLSAVRVSIFAGLGRHVSSRSILYAEPLCDPTREGREALARLIQEHDRVMKPHALFAEIRPVDAPADERTVLEKSGYVFEEYLNYVVDVSPGVDVLWNKLGKSTQRAIRRSRERGLQVIRESTHDSIDRMYALVQESYERSRVPLVSAALFHAALDCFPRDVVQVRIATYRGEDVAGGIGLMFGGRFYAWYGGSVRIPQIAPDDCLTWDEICWTSEQGGRCYDFGGAGWPDQDYGPREFKAKFRGDLVRYGRYRRVYSPLKLLLAETGYGSFRRLKSLRRAIPFL